MGHPVQIRYTVVGTRAESCPEFVNIVYPFSPGTARYHVVDRNTLLTRWIVKVSTMNAHIYVLTEFNYVQRDIIIRMLTQMQEIKLINICSTIVVMWWYLVRCSVAF